MVKENQIILKIFILITFFISYSISEQHSTKPLNSEIKVPDSLKKNERTREEFSKDFSEITIDDLARVLKEKKVTIVDVNGNESYNEGHIPTALDFSTSDTKGFSKNLPKEKDALIVAYCGGPNCYAWSKAAQNLEEKGYTNIKHFKGGIKTWKSANKKVEKVIAKKKG